MSSCSGFCQSHFPVQVILIGTRRGKLHNIMRNLSSPPPSVLGHAPTANASAPGVCVCVCVCVLFCPQILFSQRSLVPFQSSNDFLHAANPENPSVPTKHCKQTDSCRCAVAWTVWCGSCLHGQMFLFQKFLRL